MKDYTYKNLFSSLLTKEGMAILSSLALISCGIQSGYTETDGIYYDPKSDKIEQRIDSGISTPKSCSISNQSIK